MCRGAMGTRCIDVKVYAAQYARLATRLRRYICVHLHDHNLANASSATDSGHFRWAEGCHRVPLPAPGC